MQDILGGNPAGRIVANNDEAFYDAFSEGNTLNSLVYQNRREKPG